MANPSTNTYVKISLRNLTANFKLLNETAGGRMFIAVVKANAYGHGAGPCAKALQEAGVQYFAVASVDEAAALRKAGITAPVLILGYVPFDRIPEAAEIDATLAVYSMSFAEALSEEALKQGKTVRVHLKYDTGMNRLGFKGEDTALAAVKALNEQPGLTLEGIFSHFATSDEADESFALAQYARFSSLLTRIREEGIEIPVIHMDNSAALLRFDHSPLTTAYRSGLALYGLAPYDDADKQGRLKPVMSFHTRLANLSAVEIGEGVGYSRTWRAKAPRRIATFACGYADGFIRAYSNKARVWVNGAYMNVAGNVCMDMFMADATDAGDLKVGDEAELFGPHIPAQELADIASTIPYEVLCLVSGRVKRIYV